MMYGKKYIVKIRNELRGKGETEASRVLADVIRNHDALAKAESSIMAIRLWADDINELRKLPANEREKRLDRLTDQIKTFAERLK